MPHVRVTSVRHVSGAAAGTQSLPDELVEPVYEQLNRYVGHELETSEHVQRLVVEGRLLSLSFFVDTDGTLWIEQIRGGT